MHPFSTTSSLISPIDITPAIVPPPISSSRSISADLLKALSIAAVVFIHSSLLLPTHSIYSEFLLPSLRFCVPVFIFLWAYFAEKAIDKRKSEINYLFNRFYLLIIPFIFWSVVYYFLTATTYKSSLTSIATKYYAGYGWSGQYYFIILFQLLILFFAVRRFSHRLTGFPILIVIASILFYTALSYSSLFNNEIISKIGCRPFFYWLPYVVLGVIYKRNNFFPNDKLFIVIAFLSPIIISIEFYYFHPITEAYLTPSVFISSILLLTSCLNSPLNFIRNNRAASRIIDVVSRNTLGIFCLNPLIILLLSYFPISFNALGLANHHILLPLVFTPLTIAACLGLVYLLKRLKLGILVTS